MLKRTPISLIVLATAAILGACSGADPESSPGEATGAPALAIVGATVVDGSGAEPVPDATVVVRGGRIESVGPSAEVEVPADAEVLDAAGKHLVPGLINAHGHVGATLGLEGGHYSRENVLRQLRLYASYGVTTVVSLGGDEPAGVEVRDEQDVPSLDRARLYVAGAVVAGITPGAALEMVHGNAAMGVDFIKIRVDDNLGSTYKMTPDVYGAVVEGAHELGLPVAAHLFYLEDAHGLLDAGADFIVHSVRDRDVDDALATRLIEAGVCYSPTLTREVSTFVYESEPEFFSDPFFLASAEPAVLEALRAPESMARYRESESAQRYKEALAQAQENLGALSDAGVTIAMGTDTGPPARFQGYFEHMELALMAESGMSPMEILVASTADAARCAGLEGVGTIEAGNWADLILLNADPLEGVENLRAIESVWIAGNEVPSVSG
ncbi:amidohydrolase family protein [Candidatus Palauibacter soopunensis]|uniref:amidohydrolase family protein n=1 Tax=Candidatus Palauibacter soopunensis TaxID=3056739 RepID=UPI00239E8648|nr:amidohydrolase family protein [Candidatus Palauibacter soopunensis]MDE2877939.1 amidohydrolase family protein [Candidatus Palauibacter soopunensis]